MIEQMKEDETGFLYIWKHGRLASFHHNLYMG